MFVMSSLKKNVLIKNWKYCDLVGFEPSTFDLPRMRLSY